MWFEPLRTILLSRSKEPQSNSTTWVSLIQDIKIFLHQVAFRHQQVHALNIFQAPDSATWWGNGAMKKKLNEQMAKFELKLTHIFPLTATPPLLQYRQFPVFWCWVKGEEKIWRCCSKLQKSQNSILLHREKTTLQYLIFISFFAPSAVLNAR